MKNIYTIIFLLFITITNAQNGEVKEYYDNGQLKSSLNYLNGELDGLCKFYYENGQLQAITTAVNGSPIGMVKTYFENGQLKTVGEYGDGENQEGIHKEYYENGNLKKTGAYIQGEEEGIHKDYYENGNLENSTTYKDGTKNGWAETYNEDGAPLKKGNIDLRNNGIGMGPEEVGIWAHWWYFENGQLEKKFLRDEYGDYQGAYELYYENGDLKEKGEYKDDERHGEWYFNYPHDNKRFKNLYENGVALRGKSVSSQYDSMTEEFFKVKFKNKCYKDIQIAIRYLNLDNEWVTKGWFNTESYEEAYLMNTNNLIFYYYAHSMDAKFKWSGEEYKTIDGIELGFKRIDIPESHGFGEFYISITCDD